MTDTTKLSIGNSDSNDIVTKHKTVSQVHAHLRRMPDGRYELTDADSTNGTMVNNRRVCILLFRPNLIPDPSTRYILIMLIGLVPVFMGIFAGSGEKKRTKLDLLKLEYEELVVCPKCTGSLLRYTPAYLINKKKCPNQKCDAIYNCSLT